MLGELSEEPVSVSPRYPLPRDPNYGLHVWLNRFERLSLGDCLNRAINGDVEASRVLLKYWVVTLHLGVVPEMRVRAYFLTASENLDGGAINRALGLKGAPSGGRPQKNQQERDDEIGRAVAEERGKGDALQEALYNVAARHKVAQRTVGRAYSNFKFTMVAEVLSAMKNDPRVDLLQGDLSDDEYDCLWLACADQAIEVVAREIKTKPKAVRKALDDFLRESGKSKVEKQ